MAASVTGQQAVKRITRRRALAPAAALRIQRRAARDLLRAAAVLLLFALAAPAGLTAASAPFDASFPANRDSGNPTVLRLPRAAGWSGGFSKTVTSLLLTCLPKSRDASASSLASRSDAPQLASRLAPVLRQLGAAGLFFGHVSSATGAPVESSADTTLAGKSEATERDFSLPAADAATALEAFSEQSGVQVVFLLEQVRGISTHAVQGRFTPREALHRMTSDTVLIIAEDRKTGAFIVKRTPHAAAPSSPPSGGKDAERSSATGETSLHRKHPIAWLGSWLALAFAPALSAAEPATASASIDSAHSGIVRGTVSNAATGVFLEGAQVTLDPGGRSVLTTRDGAFRFDRVSPGEYRLTVSYAGLDSKTVAATVAHGAIATTDVALTSGIYRLAEFVVAGEREGNALAITQQRNAANIKNVISADAFGNVADLNLGNFLQRVPGFSTEISEGEIVRVQIRGANANLNAVSVDGTRAANGSTRTFERGFEIDKIPTDLIETIEITKAATPDVDADSIGGAVNLKTKSALDRKGRWINFSYGYNYNWAKKTFRPAGSFGYSDLLLGGKLGVMVTGSYNETHRPRDANGITWQPTTDLSQPAWFNADTFGQDQVKHTRGGFGLRFDYKLSDTTRLYFSSQFSYYYDQLNRRWGRLSTLGAANVLSVADKVVETRNQTFTYFQTLRNRDLITNNFTLGGESTVWGGKLDFNGNFSPSKGTDLGRLAPNRTVAGVGFRQHRSADNKFITLTQISGPDILDPNNSLFTSFDSPESVSRDRILGAQVNYRKPLDLAIPLAIKTGARLRVQTRERDNTRHLYSYVGPNGVAGPVGAANDDNLARLLDTGYDYTPNTSQPKHAGLAISDQFLHLDRLRAELAGSPQLFREDLVAGTRDSIRNDNKVTETVTATYLMGDLRLGRLNVVGGVRMENTAVEGQGFRQEITLEERARRAAWVGTVTPEETVRRTLAEFGNRMKRKGDYRNFFPSLHLKYDIAPGLLARASYSNGIGRPNFGSIVPTTTVNHDNLTISANNPDLRPQYAKNYDLTLEYYFRPAGLASIAVFEKRITDFIFRQGGLVLGPGNEFGDAFNGYMLTTDYNGGSARIRGLELSIQQQFSQLPGFWKGFGVFANFTWQETRGDYGTPGTLTTHNELPNFTPRGGNMGISYNAHPWSARILANHTGNRLLAYSADPSQRQYLIEATPIDLNVSYQLTRHLRLYVDVINVFNEGRQYQYRWIPDHRSDTWVYTTVVKFGLSGTF